LLIPGQQDAKTDKRKSITAKRPKSYQVKAGDTACGIAQRLRVGCRGLVKLNKLSRRAIIRVGMKLLIPTS
jgi:LysM repeat protein